MAKKRKTTPKIGPTGKSRPKKTGNPAGALGMMTELLGSLDDTAKQQLFESLLGEDFPAELLRSGPKPRDEVDRLIAEGLNQPSPAKAIPLFQQAAAVARRRMGKDFDAQAGRFDQLKHGRAYISASGQLVMAYRAAGRADDSRTLAEDLLRLAPEDKWGVRGLLLAQYLVESKLEAAEQLLSRYEEPTAEFEFSDLLLGILQGRPDEELDRLLVFAHNGNPLVVDHLLLGPGELPEPPLQGDEVLDEAQRYAADFRTAWRESGRAVSWLREAARRLKLRRPLVDAEESNSIPADVPPSLLRSLPLHQHRQWLAGIHPLPSATDAASTDESAQWLWFVAPMNGNPLAIDLCDSQLTGDELWSLIVEQMMAPESGGRPQTIYVHPQQYVKKLRSAARGTGISIAAPPDRESLEAMLSAMCASLERAIDQSDVPEEDLHAVPIDPQAAWEVAATQLDQRISIEHHATRPWMFMVIDRTFGTVLAIDMVTEPPGAERLAKVVRSAICRPAVGAPHRPAVIYVRSADEMLDLQSRLNELDIRVEVSSRLDALDEALQSVTSHLAGERPIPALVDSPGIETGDLSEFYSAAARFSAARPWKSFAEVDVFKVESSLPADAPWHALVMGRSGVTLGLAIYKNLKTARRLLQTDPAERDDERAARQMDGFSIQFVEEFELAARDVDAIEQFGWPVTAPEAYPWLVGIRPGAELRTPTRDELRVISAALDAVASISMRPHPVATQHATDIATVTFLGSVHDIPDTRRK